MQVCDAKSITPTPGHTIAMISVMLPISLQKMMGSVWLQEANLAFKNVKLSYIAGGQKPNIAKLIQV